MSSPKNTPTSRSSLLTTGDRSGVSGINNNMTSPGHPSPTQGTDTNPAAIAMPSSRDSRYSSMDSESMEGVQHVDADDRQVLRSSPPPQEQVPPIKAGSDFASTLASLKRAFETAQEEKLHVAAEYKLREVEYKRSLAEEVARVKGLQVEKEQLKASSTDNIQLVAKLQKTESELRRRIRTLQKDDEELRRTLRVAQQEIDSLKGELHQSKTDQSLAEHQITNLQSNIDAERLDFLSDLKSLLDISSKSPNYLLTQLGISQDVVSSPGHGIFHGCLHPQSIIRGHSFRVFNAGQMQTERGSPVTDAGDSDPFFVAFCQHIVRLCLCMDQTAANDNITLLLWDIWGNLECSTLTNQQISRIANPLASLLSRISRNFSRGILSDLGFWLVGQLASLFSCWGHVDLLNIDGFYDRYKGFEHGEGLLVAAGRHQILHGRQDSQRTRVIAQSVRDGLLGTVERFPDSCRKFRAEIDSSIFNVCMFHLEDDGEDLWVLEAEGGEVLLWHGSSESCKMIEKGYAVWIHLMRPKPLDTLMVLPHVQMDSQMGRWLCDQYGQKKTKKMGSYQV
ncbi:MAG: hypothetical protein Q9202_007052 [Teloschistes flavicans]